MKQLTLTKLSPSRLGYCSTSISLRNVFHVFFSIHLIFHLANAFNLDTRIPVFKFGPKDSYFGYSVAEHVTIDKRTSQHEPVLLVGAPKALSDFDQASIGALYKCPLSTLTKDCVKLYVDPDNSTANLNSDKNDQWLGVTVKSQGEGGYVMVCAHRYVHNSSDFRWGNGICYSFSQYLDYNRHYEPCRNRMVELAHEQFGFCQAGTSGDITQNFEILIGSPGPYTWRGTIFANNIRHSIKDDKTWYMGPVIESESPVSKYSYLGMSVASGDFLSNKIIYAGGAPRSNGTGQVIFYSKDLGKNLFDLGGILQGEQLASSFGYSMAALDCDGDGRADLAVGAPFYYTRTEGGAVYVYLNKDLRAHNFEKNVKLTGKPESRFGFSLANASDLNKDGFEDLAIGAPYEKNGVVYIFMGSHSGLKSEPSQIIDAQSLLYPFNIIKTFGYSLSGNIDLDRNSYPDLLVGAYESDAILLLRSRPIIKIKTSVRGNLTQIDPNSNFCKDDDSSNMPCFSVEPCFKFLAKSLRSIYGFSLRYRIEAETFTGKKYYRAIFKSSINSDTPNIVEKTVSLEGNQYNREYCSKEVIYLKSKKDIQNSIPFKLTYSLEQDIPELPRQGEQLPNINNYPILDQDEAQRIFYGVFIKDCGSDDICESNLVLRGNLLKAKPKTKNSYTLMLTEDNIELDVHLKNKGEPAYDAFIEIEHSSNLSYVSRKIFESDQVDCSPEEKTKIKCTLSNPFKRGDVKFRILFSGNNIPDLEREFFINMRVNTTSKDISTHDNVVSFKTEIMRKAELELTGISDEQQVKFGGTVKGEAAMHYEDEIGNKVYHKYIVKNNGPWRARNVVVLISWPYELDNGREFGKWILYITAKPSVLGQNGYCELDSRYINPKNLMIDQDRTGKYQGKIRKRRAAAAVTGDKKVATLSCDSRAKCIKFKCYIQNINANRTANILIPSRLWNATFLEEFSNYHYVSIISKGQIAINPLYNIVQSRDNDQFQIETRAYPDAPYLAPSASIWYYVIGILFGVSILAIIIILLYKTGFFKRNKLSSNPNYSPVNQNEND